MRHTFARSGAVLTLLAGIVAASAGTAAFWATPSEIRWSSSDTAAQPGSSMQSSVESAIVFGDAKQDGLYSIMFRVQPHAAIPAHSHRDTRTCFVIRGMWYFGLGNAYSATLLKQLPPGSHYTEPASTNHFAHTEDEGALVACSSIGPTDTVFPNLPGK